MNIHSVKKFLYFHTYTFIFLYFKTWQDNVSYNKPKFFKQFIKKLSQPFGIFEVFLMALMILKHYFIEERTFHLATRHSKFCIFIKTCLAWFTNWTFIGLPGLKKL